MAILEQEIPVDAVRHDALTPQPGQIVSLEGAPGTGMTRLGLAMLTDVARKHPVAYLDVRGWFSPLAAWEVGIEPERLIVVRCPDRIMWPKVAAALFDGLQAVYLEVPNGINDSMLRRLAALARNRRTAVLMRPLQGRLAGGVTYRRLESVGVAWEGTEAGFGRLAARRIHLSVSGKGMPPQTLEVLDNGSHTVRVVPGLAVAPAGRAAG